jgi:hypothetical protein
VQQRGCTAADDLVEQKRRLLARTPNSRAEADKPPKPADIPLAAASSRQKAKIVDGSATKKRRTGIPW